MPTPDEIAQAEKRQQMSGKFSGGLNTLVIPEIPFRPLPQTLATRNPALADWHAEQHKSWQVWREQFNAVLARLPEATTPITPP